MDNTLSTICSLLPYQLTELKSGLNPNEYIIKAAEGAKPGLTIIPGNVYYLINPDLLSDAKEVRQIKVPVPSMEVAQSIIQDYINALLGVSPPDAIPGLFAVRGDYHDTKEFAKEHMKQIMESHRFQSRWFQNLVDIADDIWSKTHSPVSISDLERYACRALEYKRDWLSPLPSEMIEKCPVCKTPINMGALKCTACGHVLNKVEYDKVMAGVK